MVIQNNTKINNNNFNLLDKLKKDTLQYAPAIIIPALLNLLAVMIFTRLFDPNEYGIYNLIISSTTVISAIFSQWVMQSTQKFRPEYVRENKMEEFNRSIIFLIYIVVINILIVSIIVYIFFSEIIIDIVYFSSVNLVLVQVLYNIGIVVFQSDMMVNRYRFYQLLNGLFKFIFSIVLITLFYKNIIGIIWATGFALLILVIPMYKELGLFNKNILKFEKKKLYNFTKKMFSYGLPMIGWFLGNSLLGLSDRYFINFFRGAEEVGIYAANYSLVSMGLGLLCSPLLTAAHPVIMNNVGEDNFRGIQQTITKFSRLFLIVTIPISIYIITFGSDIVGFLLGSNYREGSIIFPFIVMGIMLWNISMYGHKGHEILGKSKLMMLFVIISVIVNTIFNILLIPNYGYLGAAIATLIGYTSYPILVYISSSRTIKWIVPWLSLTKILFASISSCIIVVCLIIKIEQLIFFPIIIKLLFSFIVVIFLYLLTLKLIKEKI